MDLTSGLLKSNEAIGNINPVGSYQTGYKNQLEMNRAEMENEKTRYAQDLQYKLQSAISESVNPATGQPDYIKLAEAGAKYGIDAQTLDFARKNLEANWSTYQKVAESKQAVRQMSPEGYETLQGSAKTPWQSKPVSQPAAMEQSSTLAPAVPKYTATTTSVQGIDDTQGTSTDTGLGTGDLGSTDTTGFKARAEALDKATQADKTNQYQIASQMETPLYGSVTTSGDVSASSAQGPVFDYEALANSSEGVQLKAGIDNALRKLGKNPSQEAVNELLAQAKSTIPLPRLHLKDNKPDYEATMADKNEYAAKVAKAQQEMIEKLAAGNTTAIGEVLAQAGNERAKEQQKYDLAGQKTDSFYRAVSKDEAARVRLLNETVDDITAAKKTGGFEGDYQAAVAKAKSDGSVNKDAIVAQLIAMGTVPSNRAVFLKSVMDANGNISGDIWNQVKAAVGEIFVTDPKKRDAWYKSAIDNMNESITRNGGNIKGGTGKAIKDPDEPEDKTQFTPKTGWYSMPVGTRFKVDPDDSKSQTGMVTEITTNNVTGESKALKVKLEDGSEYTVKDEGDEEDVTLEPWSKRPVGGKKNGKAKSKTRKTETAAERHKRLFGN